jgi:predicted peroxiredoxin
MKVAYICSTGTDDPTTASVPFHLAANGSAEVGQEASVLLAGHAADLIVGRAWERVEGVGLPPLRELVTKAREHAIPIYV